MNDQTTDEMRKHLNQVITIFGALRYQVRHSTKECYDSDSSSGRLSFVGRSSARQAAVMTLEILIAWHQQRAGECFAILSRVTHRPKAEVHIEAARLLQTL